MRSHALAATALLLLMTTSAAVQAADPRAPVERQGRYTMTPAEGGNFARLDTETGVVSICSRRGSDWACMDVSDDSAALRRENERLALENKDLKEEFRKLEDTAAAGPDKRPGGNGQLQLPSEQDVDAALGYVEKMYKKFRDKLRDLESDRRSTPL